MGKNLKENSPIKMQPTPRKFLLAFVALSLIELISNYLRDSVPLLHYLIKPSILMALSIYFWQETSAMKNRKRILTMQVALFFACLGDVLLMLDGPMYFQLGLGAFLMMQIGYIVVFWTGSFRGIAIPRAIIIVVFAITLFMWIRPNLGGLFVPVFVYMLTITTMVLTTLNRENKVQSDSFQWVFVGAALFMISDSLIAIEKFATPLPLREILVMLTYMAGQYLIVEGLLKELRNDD